MRIALPTAQWQIVGRFAAPVLAILVLVLILAAGGYDIGDALRALLRGSVGSPYAFFSATLVRAVPLLLTGLAVALAFRGGIINIGADGQLLAGAAAATAVAFAGLPPWIAIICALVASCLAGAAAACIPAILKRMVGVLEVITTIMCNFVALYVVGYLVRGPLQEPTRVFPQSASIDAALRLPTMWSGTRLHIGFILAVAVASVLWWYVTRTAGGLRIRMIGANKVAARSAGQIDVGRLSFRVFLVSGAIAGLAGGVEVLGVTYALYENLSPGYGYTAIAVALLARLHPLGIIATAILLGGIATGGSAMQRDASVPATLVSVMEAVIILAVVAFDARTLRRVPS